MEDNIILWDANSRTNLLPFTFTRPAASIRVGIFTIAEKFQQYLGGKINFHSNNFLPEHISDSNLVIRGNILPDSSLIKAITDLKSGEILMAKDVFIAGKFQRDIVAGLSSSIQLQSHKVVSYSGARFINHIWDIFSQNEQEILHDFELLTRERKSQPVHHSNYVKGSQRIFLEEGAIVENVSLNASAGPIYIGKDAEIMEGALIRGPFALGEHSVVKMGAKIYGGTTIGPHCKVGGEINNSVFFGYSNKGHDGFIGNAVIGEWCNIGADSNNSNLKNNYDEVKVWSYAKQGFVNTGLQFCGLFMGDHSKCAINTMFNTGTVVGVSANIFGSGFPRNYVPSFSWGGASGFITYKLDRALETAERVMARRNKKLSDHEKNLFKNIFEETSPYRNF